MHAKYLLKTLQGILMLLPLSKSFKSLKERLECINIAPFQLDNNENEELFFGKAYVLQGEMSIENCLRIFDEKQTKVSNYMLHKLQEEQHKQEDLILAKTVNKN